MDTLLPAVTAVALEDAANRLGERAICAERNEGPRPMRNGHPVARLIAEHPVPLARPVGVVDRLRALRWELFAAGSDLLTLDEIRAFRDAGRRS
jgi:hypothetical protein